MTVHEGQGNVQAPVTSAAKSGSHRDEVFQGMSCVNTSNNPNIPILMEMVGAISRAEEPSEVLRDFSEGLRKLEGPRGFISISTRGLQPGQYKITRLLVDDEVEHMADADPWATWDQLPTHEGGFIGELIRQAYPEIVHHVYLKNDPVLGNAISKYGSLIAVPLFEQGEPINWAIMLREEAKGYTEKDLEDSILRSNLVGTTVRNKMALKQLREANAVIRHEMNQIARIQKALLPRELPDIPGVRLGAHYETFDTAGGDMYDLVPRIRSDDRTTFDADGPWALLVADAAGHGPAAATVVAMLNAILYAAPDDLEGPGEVLAFANRHLVDKGFDGTFVTAILTHYCPGTRKLVYARAGHPPLVHMTPAPQGNGEPPILTRLEEVGGVPLGVLRDVIYEDATVQLKPGDSVVFYTDGITEALSPQGKMFDVKGIEQSLTECTGEPDCVISHITNSLKEHEAGVRPSDDQTIVVMKIGEL
ncbi:MAG: PP2C family protein-serine/threonine phosphatase [Planctomycetota bacterium]|nr:PP2C family protein-serine/threonine phosphatase [Planctomycetota bacterium]